MLSKVKGTLFQTFRMPRFCASCASWRPLIGLPRKGNGRDKRKRRKIMIDGQTRGQTRCWTRPNCIGICGARVTVALCRGQNAVGPELCNVLRKRMIDGQVQLDLRGRAGCGTGNAVGALGSPGKLESSSPSAKCTYLRGYTNRWK